MKEQKKPFTITNTMYHIFWCLLLIPAIITLVLHLERHDHLENSTAELQSQIERQVETNENLRHEISLYGSDAYIERVASEQLGLVKPDELVFIRSEEPLAVE